MQCTDCHRLIRPVVSIDIDGTLGDYYGHFTSFLEGYLGTSLPPGIEYPYDQEFSDWLGVDKELYREGKLAYRQGGMKRTMPAFEGVPRLFRDMRAMGCEVWVATTRPHLRLDNIDPDTRHWLERNGVIYDGLIYGEDKYEQLLQIVGPGRVVAVLDDLPEQIDLAYGMNLHPIMKTNGHSANVLIEREVPYVTNLHRAAAVLTDRIHDWWKDKGHE